MSGGSENRRSPALDLPAGWPKHYNTRSTRPSWKNRGLPEVFAVMLFAASGWSMALNLVVILLSILLMLIILIQRGKGGGLAGAFGGAGGSSPFGSRAGDAFTKITLYMAAVWVLVIMIHVKVAHLDGTRPEVAPGQTTGGG